jgi:hypothetical protein
VSQAYRYKDLSGGSQGVTARDLVGVVCSIGTRLVGSGGSTVPAQGRGLQAGQREVLSAGRNSTGVSAWRLVEVRMRIGAESCRTSSESKRPSLPAASSSVPTPYA